MTIHFDHAATSIHKPTDVATAVAYAITHLGSPGRGGYDASMQAAREVLAARLELASLIGLDDPNCVAFTSGITESLNLLVGRLIKQEDAVITTVLEHNAVLRPLYQTGCTLDFWNCDGEGRLNPEYLPGLLRPNTRFMVCTTGSNVLGSAIDIAPISQFCRENNLVLLLDTAQTLGCLPLSPQAADFICFTGHKGLLGPQGTGGVISCSEKTFFNNATTVFKTGGTGSDSFAHHQPQRMPDMFEAGTPNVPGLCGLRQGISWVHKTGLSAIFHKEHTLTCRFLQGLQQINGIHLYGEGSTENRLPVVSFNVVGLDSEEVSLTLWETHGITSRPGSHCAPLVHRRFSTEQQGMVRFSFGYHNTEAEIDTALAALEQISKL